MKRWLLVVTPALVILVIGSALVVLTDSDPEPLAPLASLETPSVAPSPTPLSGPTGSTGSPAPSVSPQPTSTAPATSATPSVDGIGDGSSGVGATGGQVDGRVFLDLTLAKEQFVTPAIANASPGSTVVIRATSVDVTDTLVVQGLHQRIDVSPGRVVTLEVKVDEPGAFQIVLEKSGAWVGNILVEP